MNYKYKAEDYIEFGTLALEIEDFYKLLEQYKKSEVSIFALEDQRNSLLFSIKHRVVDGSLKPCDADDMRNYFGDLYWESVA